MLPDGICSPYSSTTMLGASLVFCVHSKSIIPTPGIFALPCIERIASRGSPLQVCCGRLSFAAVFRLSQARGHGILSLQLVLRGVCAWKIGQTQTQRRSFHFTLSSSSQEFVLGRLGERRRKRRCADVSSLLCAHTHWQGEFVCLSSKEQPPELARRCNRMLPRRLFSKQGFPDGSRHQTHPGVCGARNESLPRSSRSLKSASLMMETNQSKRSPNVRPKAVTRFSNGLFFAILQCSRHLLVFGVFQSSWPRVVPKRSVPPHLVYSCGTLWGPQVQRCSNQTIKPPPTNNCSCVHSICSRRLASPSPA